jgi:hypothetical protein
MKLNLRPAVPPIALAIELIAGCLVPVYSGTPLAYALAWSSVLAGTVAIIGSVMFFRRQKIVSVLCILVGAWMLAQLVIPLGIR